MPKGKPNKRYTPEFKIKVVETMHNEELSYREAARQFEITNHNMVAKWERIYIEEMMMRSMIIGRVNQILIRSDIDFFGSPWYNFYCTGACTNKNLECYMLIQLKELDNDNWLETSNLSVSEKQKEFFPISNIYWIGISRYEEHTDLYAIMLDETIIGLIGLGYDEDGVSGFINPLMIDINYQGNHYAEKAMAIAIDILQKNYNVTKINLGHRKSNTAAARLYEKLGFEIIGEDEQDYFRTKVL